MSAWIVSVIFMFVVILLITERIPVDLTAIGIMVALMLTGILSPAEAVAGFANPAVITVGAMFLISRGLIRTGAVGFIVQKVIEYSRGNANRAILVILLTVAIASAFINNTPVVVLFIPIVLSLSCEYNFSPSKFLIPVSYASILAGTCTLIGTSTNIIVSDLSFMYGIGKIGMFELAPVGLPIAIIGIIFLYFAAPRLMPGHAAPTCEMEDRADRRYLAELLIAGGSNLIGNDPEKFLQIKYPTLELFEIIRDTHIYYPDDQMHIEADDLLLVKGSANDIVAILHDKLVELPHSGFKMDLTDFQKDTLIVELIVPPQSFFLGQRLLDTDLIEDPDIQIIGIKRRRIHYSYQKIQNVKLRVGDIVLIRCSDKKLKQIRTGTDFIIIEDVHHEIIHKQKARLALLIFAGLITAATSGLADIMVSALSGVFLMILTGCLQLRDSYKAMRADVLILIVGTIALGTAMQKTGTSRIYAEGFLSLFRGSDPVIILAGIILLTSLGTQVLSNNATAVLILPIAISTALALHVNPRPFIVAVCFGASACFASPIGYQTNLLVFSPGSYRFKDYLMLGIPLNCMVILLGALLIPVFWPL